ncbi:acetyl-coenzyme A carboxylase carboxyltransferase subunit beta [Striga asiatica]|uniref:Acetyl-coenzyme A carboxylase carboxyltransferase subunit beta n=1 Tax=Striga asiatica TaxID=4170 RepID=A0A5A7RCY4_STRAF|nr:acetyl-coenzyme A carboxylase carboxyltransferase subunit beta [Striga asiatica]
MEGIQLRGDTFGCNVYAFVRFALFILFAHIFYSLTRKDGGVFVLAAPKRGGAPASFGRPTPTACISPGAAISYAGERRTNGEVAANGEVVRTSEMCISGGWSAAWWRGDVVTATARGAGVSPDRQVDPKSARMYLPVPAIEREKIMWTTGSSRFACFTWLLWLCHLHLVIMKLDRIIKHVPFN